MSPEYLEKIAALAHERIERLSDLGPLCAFFFAGRIELRPEQLRAGKLDDETLRKAFALALGLFDGLPQWDQAGIQGAVRRLSEVLGIKLRDAVRPFYVAMSGSPQSVPLFDSMELLGRDLVRERLRVALELLGGATNAELARWRDALTTGNGVADSALEGEA